MSDTSLKNLENIRTQIELLKQRLDNIDKSLELQEKVLDHLHKNSISLMKDAFSYRKENHSTTNEIMKSAFTSRKLPKILFKK